MQLLLILSPFLMGLFFLAVAAIISGGLTALLWNWLLTQAAQ